MIVKLMLNKSEQEKVAVYRLLASLPENSYSKNGLMDEFSFSYNRLCAVLDEIDKDLQHLSSGRKTLLYNGKVTVASDMLELEKYMTFVLKESITHKFLLALLLEEGTSEQFCSKYQVSESYLRRNIKKLITYLNRFKVHVTISTLKISGDERLIRILFTFLIWNSSFGEELIMPPHLVEKMMHAFDPILKLPPKANYSFGYNQRLRQLHGKILYIRFNRGHFLKDDKGYDALIAENYTGCYQLLQEILGTSAEMADTEARFLAFLAFYGPTYSFENDPLFDVPRGELEQRSEDIFAFFTYFNQKILHPLLKNYPNPKRVVLLEANLSNIFFNYLIFKQPIPFFSFFQHEAFQNDQVIFPIIYQRINEFLTLLSERGSWIKNCIKDMTLILTQLILPTLREHQKSIKLNVSILSVDNYVYINRVTSLLTDLSFVELVPYQAAECQAIDLLIYPSKLFQQVDETLPSITLVPALPQEEVFSVYEQMKVLYEEKLRNYFMAILEEGNK
ncbi:helix-turn-helix domain-containing protein [Enterococcus sp. LJL128]|uniref:helix-turn-helix domain-containing protein n=1 Tax=Enterococcus sp. LJL51 TaxID=3416656 RepID=UPI003CF74F63